MRAFCDLAIRVTGDRSQRSRNWMGSETRVGYDHDHSRLAYVELDTNEKVATVTGSRCSNTTLSPQ